ncbi:MAG: response regulator [Betaproteobacteria bacterium]
MASKQILLVEDNPHLYELTTSSISVAAPDCAVVWARDGRRALDFLWARADFSHRDPSSLPDLVILDLNLPDLSGLQVLRQLRAQPRTALVPVVMLTSSRLPEDILACYRHGANGYVAKPVAFSQYRSKLLRLVQFWLEVNEAPLPL